MQNVAQREDLITNFHSHSQNLVDDCCLQQFSIQWSVKLKRCTMNVRLFCLGCLLIYCEPITTERAPTLDIVFHNNLINYTWPTVQENLFQ